eukprot:COSAG06_NODE_3845_length_4841_cov_17.994095_6_plen_97_part_00
MFDVSISDDSNLIDMLCYNYYIILHVSHIALHYYDIIFFSYFGRAGGKGDWGSLGSASGQGTDGSSDGGGAAAPAPQEQDGGGSSSGGTFARQSLI